MQIFYDPKEWRTLHSSCSESLGLIPTMGHLHAGHQSLIERSKKENKTTLVSIYVNPTQFNQAEDFNRYPKTLEADLALLQQLNVDYCFLPTNEVMYPDHFTYQIHETTHTKQLEGKYRPGHFTGVLTIVMKLLLLTQPTRAYFGLKDYEQYHFIDGLTKAFFLKTEIVPCETVRSPTGLALSSRNSRLSPEGLKKADTFAHLFHAQDTLENIKARLTQAGITVEYLEEWNNRRFAVVYIESVRLIDNILI